MLIVSEEYVSGIIGFELIVIPVNVYVKADTDSNPLTTSSIYPTLSNIEYEQEHGWVSPQFRTINFSHPVTESTNLTITEVAPSKDIVVGGELGFGKDDGNSKDTVGGIDVDPDIKKQ
jgi:hypothetical protein